MHSSSGRVRTALEENVAAQLDRINDVIARTLEEAKKAATPMDYQSQRSDIESLGTSDLPYNFDALSECRGVASEAGYFSEPPIPWDGEDALDSLLLLLDRTHMQLEDCLVRLQKEQRKLVTVTQSVNLTPSNIEEVLAALKSLKSSASTELRLGSTIIHAKLVDPDRKAIESKDTEVARTVRLLEEQRKLEENRREESERREADIMGELRMLKTEKKTLEEKHARLMDTVRRQNLETLLIKEKIELLLHDQESSASDLSSIYCGEDSGNPRARYERELDVLRKQVNSLELDEDERQNLRRDMDLAEDVLVRVVNGDDPRKLFLQMTVVKNKVVQYRGRQLVRDTERMASSITSALHALEHDHQLQKSKNRIRENLMKKLRSPVLSPVISPVLSPRAKQVIVSLETISSPMDSPRNLQESDLSELSSAKLIASPSHSALKRQLATAEDRLSKLRSHLHELQARVDFYKSLERKMVEDHYRIKAAKARLEAFKEALEQREKELCVRERDLAVLQDELRTAAAKQIADPQEAIEFLKLQSLQVLKQSQKTSLEKMTVDLNKAEIRAAKEEISEFRKLLERQRKRLIRDQAKVDRDRKRVNDSRKEVEELLGTAE